MPDTLRFIHISDSHIGPDAEYTLNGQNALDYSHALIQHLNSLSFPVDFVLHTGDVAYNPDFAAHELAAETFAQLRYPVYYVRGNHDDAMVMRKALPNLPMDEGRINYDFILKDFHFIVLDTFGDIQPQGKLEPSQLDWLREKCATSTAQSLVIVIHHLPVKTSVAWLDEDMMIVNHEAFFEILKPFASKIRGVFYGHVHRASSALRDGILCVSAAPIVSPLETWPTQHEHRLDTATRPGYNIVTLTHEQTFVSQHGTPLE